MQKIRKAVFPIAGMGTRFLPATKAMPKELLPVVDKPVIHYALDEARAAGIEQFIFVTSRGKTVTEDHFDRHPELERLLFERGKNKALSTLESTSVPNGNIIFVRQQEPLGLGHAIWTARHVVGDEPFAVLLPDDIVLGEQPAIGQLIDSYKKIGDGMMVGVQKVPEKQISSYGVVEVEQDFGEYVKAKNIVEKPPLDKAPSNIAILGRYLLTSEIFPVIAGLQKGVGGEYQLTDAIAELMKKKSLYGRFITGERYDCGNKLEFLKAGIAFGLAHPEVGDELRAYLREKFGGKSE